MHEQTAQIGIASLANAQQAFFSSRAVLFGRKPKRSSHLSAVGKLAGVVDRCQQSRCGYRSDTAQLLQSHRYRILPCNLIDLQVELLDTFVHCQQVLPQST